MVSCKIEIPTQPYIVICRLLLYFEYLVHEHVIVIDSNYACCILIVHGFFRMILVFMGIFIQILEVFQRIQILIHLQKCKNTVMYMNYWGVFDTYRDPL